MRRSFTCNDMESSKNVARRRIQQHLNTSSYRSFRRKYKTTSRTHFGKFTEKKLNLIVSQN